MYDVVTFYAAESMSKGNAPKERARLLVKALLEYETNQGDRITNLGVNWAEDGGANLLVSATKQALFHLLKDIPEFKPTAKTRDDQVRKNIGESLTKHLNQFLGILDDHRTDQQKGVGDWTFTLRLWQRVELKNAEENILRNLVELDKLWDAKRSPQSAAAGTTTNITANIANNTIIENVENLEIKNITQDCGDRSHPITSRVTSSVKENVRLRGFASILAVPVWEGREVLLGELQQKLWEGLRVLVITGQGGMGKSSLATKLMEALGIDIQAQKLQDNCVYDGVIYFKVQQGTSFDEGAGQLLRDLGDDQKQDLLKPEEKINQIISYLAALRWLVVLDNLEAILLPARDENAGRSVSPEWGQLLNGLVYRNHQSQLLITSREMPVDLGELRGRKYSFNRKLMQEYPLEGVEKDAAVRILRDYGLQDSEEDLEWIAERVKGHPLILDILGNNYADQPGYLRKHPTLVTDEATPVLQEQLIRLDEAGRELLRRMCVLRVPIEKQGLTFLRLYTDDLEKDYRFWLAAEMEEPAELTPEEVGETEELVKKLVASSLVRWGYDKQKQEPVYDLHQVIADFLQQEYATEMPELLDRVYKFYCTGKSIANPKILADLQPILEAQHFAFQLGSYGEAYNLLSGNLRKHLYTWGHWTLMKELYEKILPHLTDTNDRAYSLREVGIIHRDSGNWNEAESYFSDALALSEEEDNKSGTATALGMLGGIARNRGNWDEAESLFNQSLELRTELGDRSGMATTRGQLGEIARNRGNWDEAESLFNQSLEVETELGDRSGMASTWEHLGYIANLRGNWDEAKRLYTESLNVRTELGDRSGMASSWGVLGDIARNRGNWDEAESLYNKSLQLRTELGDRSGMAAIWGCLGGIASNRGNWDEAETLYNKCLEVETELGDRSGMATSWGQLGYIANLRGNWDEAESLYNQCLEVETELGDRSGIAATWGVLGDVERMRCNFEAAENYKRQSFQLRQELGDRSGMAMSLCAWGEIKHLRKDFEAAEDLYLRSLEIRKTLGDKSGVAIVQGCLGANKVSQNKLDEAEELLIEALVRMESLGMSFEIAEAQYAFARLERKRGNPALAQHHYTTAVDIFTRLGAAKELERIQQEWHTEVDNAH